MHPWLSACHCHKLWMALQYPISLGLGKVLVLSGRAQFICILFSADGEELSLVILLAARAGTSWRRLFDDTFKAPTGHYPHFIWGTPSLFLGLPHLLVIFTLNQREVNMSFLSFWNSAAEANPFFVWLIATTVCFKTLWHNEKNYHPAAINVYVAPGTNTECILKPIYTVPLIALNISIYFY